MFNQKGIKSLFFPLLAILTLGLAPHQDPHILGKIEWIAGGAKGMQAIDWFDFIMHSAPWIWFVIAIFKLFSGRTNTSV